MGAGCAGLLPLAMATEQWGASRAAKGVSGWGCWSPENSGSYLLPLIIIQFVHGLFAAPIYPFYQLSWLSPSGSNLLLPFHNTTNQTKRLFLHLSLTCWVLHSSSATDLISPCQCVLAGW